MTSMTSMTPKNESSHECWTRDGYMISTDKSLLSASAINSAFEQDWMHWATRLPEDVIQQLINGSFCFGVYTKDASLDDANTPEHGGSQVGFARLITDNTTNAYLTDVYVLPEYRGTGLGGWLLDCVNEYVSAKPYMRWTMLRTTSSTSRDAYKKRLGMMVLESDAGDTGPYMMGKKGDANKSLALDPRWLGKE